MKGHSLWQRFIYAFSGIAHAIRSERSFRTQLFASLCVAGTVLWLRPPLIWAAMLAVMVVLVLALELINTAMEELLDGLHPARAEFVRRAKDCAAGAVLLLSFGSVLVFVLMLADMGCTTVALLLKCSG